MREPIDSYTERIDVQMDGSLRRSNTSKNKRIDNPSSANLDTVVEKKDEQVKLSDKATNNAAPIQMRELTNSYAEDLNVQMDGSLQRSNTSKNKRIDNPSSDNPDTVVEKKDEQVKLSDKATNNAAPIQMREPTNSYTEHLNVQMDGSLRRSNTSKNKRIDNQIGRASCRERVFRAV